jgi:hypothetical protein
VNAAGMIIVTVRIDDQAHVFCLEAKLLDVTVDQFRRLREAAVEQNMATRRRDQHGRQPGCADVKRVSKKTDRIARGVPRIAGWADFRRIRAECPWNLSNRQQAEEDHRDYSHDSSPTTLRQSPHFSFENQHRLPV